MVLYTIESLKERFAEQCERTHNYPTAVKLYSKNEGWIMTKKVFHCEMQMHTGQIITGTGDTEEIATLICFNNVYNFLKKRPTFRNKRNALVYG